MSTSSAPAFRGLPRAARIYLSAVFLAVPLTVVAAQHFLGGPELDLWLLGAAAIACATASLFEVFAPGHYSFQPNLVFMFWGAVLLPPWAIALLALVCFQPGWAARRVPWYMAAFNVANYVLAGLAVHLVQHETGVLEFSSTGAETVLGLGLAVIAFVALNHGLIIAAVSLSRARPLLQTATDMADGLPLDAALAMTGACLAGLWFEDPLLVLLAAGPMMLVYRALWVPLLQQKSRTDPKTGLYNSEHFTEQFADGLRLARKRGTDLSVVMLDLDHLRLVNNRHGHLGGDELLRAVADIVSETTGSAGLPARFGGDEMCLLLPDRSIGDARELAEAIRVKVQELRRELEADGSRVELTTTISAGIAGYPEHGDTVNGLLNAADAAVYDAKLGGRNRVRIALPPGTREALDSSRAAPPAIEEGAPPLRQNGDGKPAPVLAPAPAPSPSEPTAAPIPAPAQAPAVPGLIPEPNANADHADDPRGDAAQTRRFIPWYALLLCAVAGAIGLASSPQEILDSPALFALLIASVLALDLVRIDIFERGTISPSAVPTLALAYLFGPLGPLAAEAVAAAMNLARRKSVVQTAFDFGALTIAGSAAAVVFHVLPTDGRLLLLAGAALAGGAYYAVNVPLLATVMALANRKSPLAVWREGLAWLWPHYVAFGLLAGAFAASVEALGLYAFVVFGLPVLMLWVAEKQYVDRSRSSVEELRRSYDDLEVANKRLRGLLEDNQQLLGRMHRSYLSTITSLARTIEAKDPYTGGHTERVAQLALALATELEFTETELQAVNVGALIHDIGKIGVSDQVLLKEGKLSDLEFAEIQRHPEISSYIVADLELPSIVKQMVRSHHERFDGTGYPDRLVGDEIPLAARILSVADALDAMTSDRPYRKALTIDVARAEIAAKAGTQFCPRVVGALGACFERRPSFWADFSPPQADRPAAAAAE